MIPWNKGKHHSDETKNKISESNKGKPSPRKGKKLSEISGRNHPMYGKHHSEESKRKMSESHKGKFFPNSGQFQKGNISWIVRKKHSEESKRKMSESHKGHKPPKTAFQKGHLPWNYGIPHSEETKRKIGISNMGNPSTRKGTKVSPETLRRMSISQTKYSKSEKMIRNLQIQQKHMSKCGFPFHLPTEKYKFALMSWSVTIKSHYNNQCQVCPSQAEISHHIIHKAKYPALSLNVSNGIALCKKCHNECHGWKLDETVSKLIV